MLELAIIAFTTLFVTVGPIDIAPIFAVLTKNHNAAEKRHLAIKGTFIATIILLVFALLGDLMLAYTGISLAALQVAGGILLLLISIDMVFVRESGGVSATDDEKKEAKHKEDISVFPLATPLIAGAGSMSALILLMGNAAGNIYEQLIIIGALLAVMLIALFSLIVAGTLQKMLGVTGMNVITRIFGVILAGLSIQFIFDGIAGSGLLN